MAFLAGSCLSPSAFSRERLSRPEDNMGSFNMLLPSNVFARSSRQPSTSPNTSLQAGLSISNSLHGIVFN